MAVSAHDNGGARKAPFHPYLVMLVAAVLPGVGQLLNEQPRRALTMLFFMILLGLVTMNLSGPEQSFVGRFAGGFFVYAVSVMDAYRWARVRWETFHAANGPRG
jgi:hypothetical protein